VGDPNVAAAVISVFSMVESENYEILAKWLSRTPRQSDRYSFGATAEVKDLGSRNEQILITRDLSAGGCFIKTAAPLPKGSRIRVRIMHSGSEFTAIGRVTHNISAEGMGVEFIEVETKDRAILDCGPSKMEWNVFDARADKKLKRSPTQRSGGGRNPYSLLTDMRQHNVNSYDRHSNDDRANQGL
jgi:hypothetical protein